MASKYDWEFIQPLNQTANIAALSQGNQQINAGLQGMGNAVTGYADAMKQRNTDEILNTLMGAQSSAELPNALSAVQALQQQYGRGYDQTAVRNAIDTRGSTLGQRDLQNINLQQAQAQQAALPQIQAFNEARLKASGAPPEQIAALGGIQGVDTTQQAVAAIGDTRYAAEGAERKGNRAEDVAYRNAQTLQSQQNWDKSFGLQQQSAAIQAANYLVPKAGETTSFFDSDGKVVTSAQPSRSQALAGASGLVNAIIGSESGFNSNAKNPNSSATGAGQFINSTWLSTIKKNRPDLVNGKSDEQLLALRKDPQLSAQMTEAYAKENATGLQNKGLPATDSNIYLAHFAGLGGASSLLKANPNASAESVLGAKVANANGNVVKGKTVGQVIEWANSKVSGASQGGTAAQASQAILGITPANLATVKGGYNESINNLNATFNNDRAKEQTKGSLAATGKNVDTWAAGKADSGLIFAGNNSFFTSASDLAKMVKADKTFGSLPQAAQMNILEGAYAKLNDVNAFQYVKDSDLKKFISTEAKQYSVDQTNQFEQQKKAAFETAYQSLTQNYQAAGVKAPTREVASRMLGITQPSKPQAKPDAVAPKPKAQDVSTAPPKAATPVTPKVTQLEKNLAARTERKKAEWDVTMKRLAKEKADKDSKAKRTATFGTGQFKLPVGSTKLSQAEIDKLLKDYKVR